MLHAALALVAVALVALELLRRRRDRIFQAAVLEQERKEKEAHVRYRHDQRVRAVQQRLSRAFGKRAFGKRLQRRIEQHLRKG